MTLYARIITLAAVLVALAVGAQAQTPEIDALRARAEQGDADAQSNPWVMYAQGRGVVQDYVQAHMWRNVAASRQTGEERKISADGLDALASLMTSAQVDEAQRLAREWDAAHPR